MDLLYRGFIVGAVFFGVAWVIIQLLDATWEWGEKGFKWPWVSRKEHEAVKADLWQRVNFYRLAYFYQGKKDGRRAEHIRGLEATNRRLRDRIRKLEETLWF